MKKNFFHILFYFIIIIIFICFEYIYIGKMFLRCIVGKKHVWDAGASIRYITGAFTSPTLLLSFILSIFFFPFAFFFSFFLSCTLYNANPKDFPLASWCLCRHFYYFISRVRKIIFFFFSFSHFYPFYSLIPHSIIRHLVYHPLIRELSPVSAQQINKKKRKKIFFNISKKKFF